MMKKVRKSDSPMMIWLDGAPCRDRAERTKESTMTMRVKQVINKMMDGARVSRVITARILMALSTSTGWLKPAPPMFKLIVLVLPPSARAWNVPQRRTSSNGSQRRKNATRCSGGL